MIDWKIQPRAHGCQACHQHFVDKQLYYTLLVEERHVLQRLDVCATCWQNQYGQGAKERKGFISFWHGLFMQPPAAPPEPIQKDTAESLLRKLAALNDPQYMAACFILAVMLERKRVFKVKAQTTQNGQRTLVYEHGKTGDIFTIADPNLQLHQLDKVQHDVSQLLEHGLPTPPPVPASQETPVALSPAGAVGEIKPPDSINGNESSLPADNQDAAQTIAVAMGGAELISPAAVPVEAITPGQPEDSIKNSNSEPPKPPDLLNK